MGQAACRAASCVVGQAARRTVATALAAEQSLLLLLLLGEWGARPDRRPAKAGGSRGQPDQAEQAVQAVAGPGQEQRLQKEEEEGGQQEALVRLITRTPMPAWIQRRRRCPGQLGMR
jgi:hypothetical protein